MTMNTGICAGSGTLVYPAAGPNAVRPHAPTSICGTAVSYDAAGNTLSYDVDGPAGPKLPRSFLYDGENRPIAISQNGNATTFAYGADSERTLKSFNGSSSAVMVTCWSIRHLAKACSPPACISM